MPDLTREEIEQVVKASQQFIDANLVGIDLNGAYLNDAILRKANLSEADLSGADLREAKYNKSTKFPEDFDPEEARMVLVE